MVDMIHFLFTGGAQPFEEIEKELIAEASAWQAWVCLSFVESLHRHALIRVWLSMSQCICHQAPQATDTGAVSATKEFYNLINKGVSGMVLSDADVPEPVWEIRIGDRRPAGFNVSAVSSDMSAFF